VTRHTPNPLRALADIPLLVSAHDEQPHLLPQKEYARLGSAWKLSDVLSAHAEIQ